MSGHSKWNNIKRKKEKTDGAKAKVHQRMAGNQLKKFLPVQRYFSP